MKILYATQNFLSHRRVAIDYRRVLANLCEVVDDPADCDVAVLHEEPTRYRRTLQDLPVLLDRYVIGYAVWEASHLPANYERNLPAMDELWTASAYCYHVLAKAHPQVQWIPHVVACDTTCTADDMAQARELLGELPANAFVYFNITQDGISRKNTGGLLAAFPFVAARVPGARLVIKTLDYPLREDEPATTSRVGNVITISGRLPPGVLSALYRLSHVYVSAHHSEGWGLPMSDAMVHERAVVCTGYSGNMDFTTRHNALLVNYTEGYLGNADVNPLFNTTMRWALPHRESLERQMLAAWRMQADGTLQDREARARADIRSYDDAHMTALLKPRIAALEAGLQNGTLRRLGRPYR